MRETQKPAKLWSIFGRAHPGLNMIIRRDFHSAVALLAICCQVTFPYWASAETPQMQGFLAAAEKGDAPAQFAAGVIYETSHEVPQDFAKAAEWYRKAAEQDYRPAQVSIGYLHQTGRGVPLDAAIAADWYRRAAEGGDVSGQFHLAVAYVNGIGVAKDAKQAAQWMFKAADAGDQQAQLLFATMLQTGTGVKANDFAARRWFDKAAKGRDQNLAKQAETMRQKIDDRVLFSGAFRPEDIAAVVALGFGLAALMYAIVPEHARTGPDPNYTWSTYQPPDLYIPDFGGSTPRRTPSFISNKPRPAGFLGDFSARSARSWNPQ
jgi:TPR repeat protein